MTQKTLRRLRATPSQLDTLQNVGSVLLALLLVAFTTWVGTVVFFELVAVLFR